MNQIMRVGKGILVALEANVRPEVVQHFREAWREGMPTIPIFIVSEARIVERDEITLFEFTGEVTPTLIAEFQPWWEGVTHGHD